MYLNLIYAQLLVHCHFVGFVRKSKSFVSDSDSEEDREENVPVEFREEDVVGVEE